MPMLEGAILSQLMGFLSNGTGTNKDFDMVLLQFEKVIHDMAISHFKIPEESVGKFIQEQIQVSPNTPSYAVIIVAIEAIAQKANHGGTHHRKSTNFSVKSKESPRTTNYGARPRITSASVTLQGKPAASQDN